MVFGHWKRRVVRFDTISDFMGSSRNGSRGCRFYGDLTSGWGVDSNEPSLDMVATCRDLPSSLQISSILTFFLQTTKHITRTLQISWFLRLGWIYSAPPGLGSCEVRRQGRLGPCSEVALLDSTLGGFDEDFSTLSRSSSSNTTIK